MCVGQSVVTTIFAQTEISQALLPSSRGRIPLSLMIPEFSSAVSIFWTYFAFQLNVLTVMTMTWSLAKVQSEEYLFAHAYFVTSTFPAVSNTTPSLCHFHPVTDRHALLWQCRKESPDLPPPLHHLSSRCLAILNQIQKQSFSIMTWSQHQAPSQRHHRCLSSGGSFLHLGIS